MKPNMIFFSSYIIFNSSQHCLKLKQFPRKKNTTQYRQSPQGCHLKQYKSVVLCRKKHLFILCGNQGLLRLQNAVHQCIIFKFHTPSPCNAHLLISCDSQWSNIPSKWILSTFFLSCVISLILKLFPTHLLILLEFKLNRD